MLYQLSYVGIGALWPLWVFGSASGPFNFAKRVKGPARIPLSRTAKPFAFSAKIEPPKYRSAKSCQKKKLAATRRNSRAELRIFPKRPLVGRAASISAVLRPIHFRLNSLEINPESIQRKIRISLSLPHPA